MVFNFFYLICELDIIDLVFVRDKKEKRTRYDIKKIKYVSVWDSSVPSDKELFSIVYFFYNVFIGGVVILLHVMLPFLIAL